MDYFQILFYIGFFIFLVFVVSVLIGVPPLSTHKKQARKMIELSGLGSGMTAIDLGSGAGRLLFMAAKTGAKVVGYELNPFLFIWTKLMILAKGLKGQVDVKFKSLYRAELKDVDVVFAFLFPRPMERLSAKLFSEMKSGAKVISYTFAIPDRQPAQKEEGIMVYEV